MSDINLACHMAPWGSGGFINALSDIEAARFRGLELTVEVVEQFEDRVAVFNEILGQHRLELIAITSGGAMWPGMKLEEEVERSLRIARFLRAAGARLLTLYPPRPNPEHPIKEELDLVPVAEAYGEIARRTRELEVVTCLHPEAGTCVHDLPSLEQFLRISDPDALRLCVDSGFLAEANITVPEFLKTYGKQVGLVHLRDIRAKDLKPRKSHTRKGKEPWRPTAVELGKGNLDLNALVNALLELQYIGWATIEFDKPAHHSLKELAKACHEYAEQNLDLVL